MEIFTICSTQERRMGQPKNHEQLADYGDFSNDCLPDRSGLVTREEFVDYFGPFASRIFLLCDVKKN